MNKVIGLAGVAFSGKDATAEVLESHGWKRTYMSEPLERALLAMNPWVYVPLDFGRKLALVRWKGRYMRYQEIHAKVGYDASKQIPEVRLYLQRLGTEVGRDILGGDTWVKVAKQTLKAWVAEGHNACITGIRFPNELDMIHSLKGGLVVWVERGLAPVNGHASDNSLTKDDCDYVLDNTGTLDDLKIRVEKELL